MREPIREVIKEVREKILREQTYQEAKLNLKYQYPTLTEKNFYGWVIAFMTNKEIYSDLINNRL